ncbi:hypothetical protein [Paenibacillus sacheonensis]|uniref:Uncharacterized protein n=1 Tax=Paenibacillus sacheonensis TaxID=742054 RepID=A0A7X5BZ12_9BACL|nr:hypothetical protein [Paenibacillus sacheonensis]MBM7565760.1 acyl carrier protein phosphodiesterase [Paenibacillus sacheonensis]NBC72183.1 hypothetical protein [Paenibacillus sacheonensis]
MFEHNEILRKFDSVEQLFSNLIEITAKSTLKLSDIEERIISIEERILSIENWLWRYEKKFADQEKVMKMLSKNSLIDGLVRYKYFSSKIVPFHLQSREYQESSMRSARDDDEDE